VVGADPALGRILRDQALAGFAEVPASRRQPLLDTLLSWLLHAGNRAEVGADLHVHPQTVSYRMDRVRELVGDRLDDPHRRWELLLALMIARIDPD
jgi:DNA-binding PucR family transcriptional regulator